MYSDGVVTLAPFERNDLDRVLTWVNDPELCRGVDRVLPVTRLEHERWYESLITRQDAVTFAIRHTGDTIGLCGLKSIHPRNHNADLWIYIGEAAHRGRHLGRRAVLLLTRFGFEQLNLHRVYLHVLEYNLTARKAYAACGFRDEGYDREHIYIDGAYRGACRMGILRGELCNVIESPANARERLTPVS